MTEGSESTIDEEMIRENRARTLAYLAGPEYQNYKRRDEKLCALVGPTPHSRPYDINGRVVQNGDRVRSTPGYRGPEIVEGVAEHVGEGCPGLGPSPSIICVGGAYSAASLWEVIDP